MVPPPARRADFPLWLLVIMASGALAFGLALRSDQQAATLALLTRGLWVTLQVTGVAFAGASLLGVVLALGSQSRFWLLRQLVRLYVEVMRGIPILVLLLYVAFVGTPLLVQGWNALGLPELRTRDVPLIWRAVAALTLAYGAFLAEVFRAGLQSVDPGQIDAARALGLTRWQCLRHVVGPQAFRTILPPWGNDLVAMVKDSSLVSVLGVADVTQLGKLAAASNFRYFETYNLVALIYLTLTILISLLLRWLEGALRQRTGQ